MLPGCSVGGRLLPGTPKYLEVSQSTKKYPKVPRSIPKYLKVPRSTTMYHAVPNELLSRAPRVFSCSRLGDCPLGDSSLLHIVFVKEVFKI